MNLFDDLLKERAIENKCFNRQVDRNLQGQKLEKLGKNDEAKINEAIKLYELNLNENFEGNFPYERLAIIYRRRKEYDKEIRVIKKAIEIMKKKNPQKINKFKKRLVKAEKIKFNKLLSWSRIMYQSTYQEKKFWVFII